ncbi:hypothetical protein Rs2_48962 [Raphanus sativus]|nr:hypothetical protein Rs2_48962 [Raphanus sativus]
MAETAISTLLKRKETSKKQKPSPRRFKRQKASSSSTSYNEVQCLLDNVEAQNEADSELTSLITHTSARNLNREQNAAVFENPPSLLFFSLLFVVFVRSKGRRIRNRQRERESDEASFRSFRRRTRDT